MARRYSSEESKKRILSACVKLFIEKGYCNTTIAEVLKEADVTSSTFQNIFRSKDGVLMCLTEFMFDSQFEAAGRAAKDINPVFLYAAETALQIALTEISENLRDVYVEAYTYPETAEYIYRRTSAELKRIFSPYMPDCSDSDFYELEIGTAGIMRSYMAKKCDMYFTVEKKLERFLIMSLGAYNVPMEERRAAVEFVLSMDIEKTAREIMRRLFEALEMKFEFKLDENVIDFGRNEL